MRNRVGGLLIAAAPFSTLGQTVTVSKKPLPEDPFEAVAKHLGCDDDKARFEAKLGKLAKAQPKGK